MAGARELARAASPVPLGAGAVVSSLQYTLTGDEWLRLTTYNLLFSSHPVELIGRVWRSADQKFDLFRHPHVAAPNAFTTTEIKLQPGALLNLRIGTPNATGFSLGVLFGRVQLLSGHGPSATVIGTLLQGYFDNRNDRGWPGSTLEDVQSGNGVLTGNQIAFDPGLPNMRITLAANVRARFVCFAFDLATGPAGGNREVIVSVQDQGFNPIGVFVANITQPVNTTWTYTIAPSVVQEMASASTMRIIPIPPDLDLPPTARILITAINQQNDDVYTPGLCLLRYWMELQ